MKIVIEITKQIYEHSKEKSEDSNDEWDAMRAIANGKLLPEHHGRIIDESKINQCYAYTEERISKNIKVIHTTITHTDAPTIIEAEEE